MKKVLLVLVGGLLGLSAFAQIEAVNPDSVAKILAAEFPTVKTPSVEFPTVGTPSVATTKSWEVQLGINRTVVTVGEKDFADVGFNVGLRSTHNITISSQPSPLNLYTNVGVLFSLKKGANNKRDISYYFFQVPFHLGLKYALDKDFSIFAEAGPYVDCLAFMTTAKKESNNNERKRKNDEEGRRNYGYGYSSGFDNVYNPHHYPPAYRSDYEPPHTYSKYYVGLGFRIGVEFQNKFSVSLSRDRSSLDLSEWSFTDGYVNYSLNVGYRL